MLGFYLLDGHDPITTDHELKMRMNRWTNVGWNWNR